MINTTVYIANTCFILLTSVSRCPISFFGVLYSYCILFHFSLMFQLLKEIDTYIQQRRIKFIKSSAYNNL